VRRPPIPIYGTFLTIRFGRIPRSERPVRVGPFLTQNRPFQELARLTQRDLPHPAGPACSEHEDIGGPLDVLGNIVWFVLAGWWLALGHLVTAVVLAFRLLGRILSLLALRSGRLAR